MVTPTTATTDTIGTNGATRPLEYDPEYLRVAYPPNEEPMADPIRLQPYLLAMLVPLVEFFEELEDAFVFNNIFLYYRLGDVLKVVAPDLMIAFGIDLDKIGAGESYHMWAVGKPPQFVMEIGSKSTARRDLNEKRDIYAQIGVPEYWLFDPPDGTRYKFILKGLRLVDGKYEEIPMTEGPGLDIRGHSVVLGLDLCWEDGALRFYDPTAGEYLKNHVETAAALAAAEAAREADREVAQAALAEVERLRALLSEQGRV